MKCPKCNTEYDDSFTFCPSCGTELKEAIESQPVSTSDEIPSSSQPSIWLSPSMRAIEARWKTLSEIRKILLAGAGIIFFCIIAVLLRVEVLRLDIPYVSNLTEILGIIWWLLMAALIIFQIIDRAKHKTSIVIPRSDLVGYQHFLDGLNEAITNLGYSAHSQTPGLYLYHKKVQINKYLALILFLFAPISMILVLVLHDFGGMYWIHIVFLLEQTVATFMVCLIPLIVYLAMFGRDRIIRIQMVDAPEGYSLTLRAPRKEYSKLRLLLHNQP